MIATFDQEGKRVPSDAELLIRCIHIYQRFLAAGGKWIERGKLKNWFLQELVLDGLSIKYITDVITDFFDWQCYGDRSLSAFLHPMNLKTVVSAEVGYMRTGTRPPLGYWIPYDPEIIPKPPKAHRRRINGQPQI